jgi:acylglycerol lipase
MASSRTADGSKRPRGNSRSPASTCSCPTVAAVVAISRIAATRPNARRLLHDAVEWLHLLNPNGPSQVAGVSWGGKLALALQRFAPARISRLALIAPGLFPQVDLPLIQKVRVGLSMWAAPKARFEIPLNDPDLFTANPARREFIRDDPLKLTHVTTSFLLASRRLDRYARAAQSDPTGCPLCLFLAGHDRIIHNQPTRNFVRMLRWPGRTIVDYPRRAPHAGVRAGAL